MDSIEQCIVERARHEQEIQNRLKRLNERKLQILECKVQKVKATDASSGDTNCSVLYQTKGMIKCIVSDKRNDQGLENQGNTSRDGSSRSRNECNDKSTSEDDTDIRPSYDTEPMAEVPYTAEYNVFVVETQHSEQPKNMNDTSLIEKVDSNTTLDSSNMCDNDKQADQNAEACDDERVALANLIANLKLDIDENKKIQKQLKKANSSLTQELKECKSTLEETNRTLEESNSTRDSFLIALQNKLTELEKYKTYLNRTTEYDTLECKLKDTLGLLAQKENDIKEAWERHTHDQWHPQPNQDLNVLLKKLLVPLALKTQNDSFTFVHELKQEMCADLKYVQSLKKDIDELESDKADFSNIYDLLLQECVSKDVMCSYLRSLSDLDAHTELQCL
ncbi:hypothetical protein Tco_0759789 [Tanacetum coccineum]